MLSTDQVKFVNAIFGDGGQNFHEIEATVDDDSVAKVNHRMCEQKTINVVER
jgi:hypothetical protein